MSSAIRWSVRTFFACLLASLLLAEGASAGAQYGGASRRDRRLRDKAETSSAGSVRSQADETVRLGMFLRELGEKGVDGLVLMQGMEDIPITPFSQRRGSAAKMAGRIAEIIPCQMQETEDYCFLYPLGFEALTQIQLASLDPVYDDVRAEMVFGANLPLYMVLAWISQATGKTIVADNLAAAAVTGELALGEVPLRTGLEALLKSARAVGVGVDSSPEYIFFYHPARNPYSHKRSLLIHDGELTPEQQALLDRRVSAVLPAASGTRGPVPFQSGAQPFSTAVKSLSRQLGIPIDIDTALADLPVNPAAFSQLRLGTVLDLTIRQWLYPDIGYEVRNDRIVIRRLLSPSSTEKADSDMKRVVIDEDGTPEQESAEVSEETSVAPETTSTAAVDTAVPEEASEEPAAEESPSPEAARADTQAAEVQALAQQLAAERAAAEAAAQKAAEMKAEAEEALKRLSEERKAAEEAIRKAQEISAAEKAAAEKAAAEKAAAEKAAAEEAARKAAEEQAAAEKAAAEKAAAEEAARKAAEEQAAAEKAAAEEAAVEKPPTLKSRLEQLKAELEESLAPETKQAFQQGIDEVAQSGMVDKAKKPGDPAPRFELPNASGQPVKLDELLAQGPVVLVWFRGNWCPYCNLQLKAMQEALPRIAGQGARVLALSPQKTEHSAKAVQDAQLGFDVLVDADNKVARQYGIAFKLSDDTAAQLSARVDLADYNGGNARELPLSAVYLVDGGGVIRYAFLRADYRLRAEPADIIAALKKLKESPPPAPKPEPAPVPEPEAAPAPEPEPAPVPEPEPAPAPEPEPAPAPEPEAAPAPEPEAAPAPEPEPAPAPEPEAAPAPEPEPAPAPEPEPAPAPEPEAATPPA